MIRWIPLLVFTLLVTPVARAQIKLLNVSYDPTRELYDDLNLAFADQYKSDTGKTITIEQSHGGSGKQAHAVIDGLQADVVTLGLGWDVSAIERAGLIKPGWQSRLPDNASPYTSTIVFVVHKGNPKHVNDWPDLLRGGVQTVVPNPKTSGGARWAFLAAYGAAGGAGTSDKIDDAKATAYVTALYNHVPVLDTGARGATVTFAQKNVGDVLLTWENEAHLLLGEFGQDKFEVVYPRVSILAEPPVAVVDQVVDARGTRAAAEAYVKYLYTPDAQEIIASHHYRPRDPAKLKAFESKLPKLKLFTIDQAFGGWSKAQPKFFGDGGVFDRIYQPK
jgi:sulfate/thiosulfate transport system substrate-binding protein